MLAIISDVVLVVGPWMSLYDKFTVLGPGLGLEGPLLDGLGKAGCL